MRYSVVGLALAASVLAAGCGGDAGDTRGVEPVPWAFVSKMVRAPAGSYKKATIIEINGRRRVLLREWVVYDLRRRFLDRRIGLGRRSADAAGREIRDSSCAEPTLSLHVAAHPDVEPGRAEGVRHAVDRDAAKSSRADDGIPAAGPTRHPACRGITGGTRGREAGGKATSARRYTSYRYPPARACRRHPSLRHIPMSLPR